MKLEDIKKYVNELGYFGRAKKYEKYSKKLKNFSFWHTKIEDWTDRMYLEFYNLTEFGEFPKKEPKKRKNKYAKRERKTEVRYNVCGEILDIYQLRQLYPQISRTNIDNQVKRKGYYENRQKTIKITKNEQ